MTKKTFICATCLALSAVAMPLTTGCTIQMVPSQCSIDNNTCNSNQYCMFAEGSCGENGDTGTCQSLPEVCIELFAPVCGCDGQTYTNNCKAAGVGINILATGACREN